MAFITPEEFKAYPLPITEKQWQLIGPDQVAVILQFASDHLEDYMDRRILNGNYVDKLRGAGLATQMLSQYPVTAINAVTAYGPTNQGISYNVGRFIFNSTSGILEWGDKTESRFDKYNTYWVDYEAGYETIPGPIKFATALQATKMLQPLFRGGVAFTEVELIQDLDEQIVELLEPYRRKTTH